MAKLEAIGRGAGTVAKEGVKTAGYGLLANFTVWTADYFRYAYQNVVDKGMQIDSPEGEAIMDRFQGGLELNTVGGALGALALGLIIRSFAKGKW